MNKVVRLIAAALMAYFVIMCAAILFGAFIDSGEMVEVWLAILEYIPFGKTLGTISLKLFNESVGLGKNMVDYALGLNKLSPANFLFDLCKLMLTGMFIDAVSFFLETCMGVKGNVGFYNILMKGICGIVSAFVCTGITILLMGYLGSQLSVFSNPVQIIISSIVACLTIVGSVGIFHSIIGGGIAVALLMTLVKTMIVNAIKVSATYVGTLLIFLFIAQGEYMKVLPVVAAWGVVILMMLGIEGMLESAFS